MLDHDQLIPEETLEQNQVLIEDLSHYYETRDEDRASLARIRTRLLQNAATSLPIADAETMTQSHFHCKRFLRRPLRRTPTVR
jgi:hypothetical protein